MAAPANRGSLSLQEKKKLLERLENEESDNPWWIKSA
jgi:hypothetical protein